MKRSIFSRFLQASIAADPVSPEVAPITVMCSPFCESTWSNILLTTWRAKSLNDNVGPWNNSKSHREGAISTIGAISSDPSEQKSLYALFVIVLSAESSMSSPIKGFIKRAANWE
ncbi:MAG: hypothetical protein CMM33_02480 [Rhodospirillaceae bacterium]|nr:hypothetical protein [Rhodospirillaceae bacterium]